MSSLILYFDESGTDISEPAVAVACYVATCDQWMSFSENWHWLKEWSDVGDYFHRTDQERFGNTNEPKIEIVGSKLPSYRLSTR